MKIRKMSMRSWKNKVLQHVVTDNIIELNKLIYAGAKLGSNKIGIPHKRI